MKTLKLEPNLNCAWKGWAVGRVGYIAWSCTYLVDLVGSESIFEVLLGLLYFVRYVLHMWTGLVRTGSANIRVSDPGPSIIRRFIQEQ